MKKIWKYALVALMAFAMLFSFTACSDDEDEVEDTQDLTEDNTDDSQDQTEDGTGTVSDLSDAEIVDIVADGFVSALTTGYSSSDASYLYYDADGNQVASDAYDSSTGYMVQVVAAEYAEWSVNLSNKYTDIITVKDY